MNSLKQAEALARLRFLDEIEAKLIGEALPKIKDSGLANELEQARADHERHASAIDELFGDCGPSQGRVSQQLQTQAQRWLDAVRATDDQQELVRMLLAAERAEVNAYESADAAKLPGDEGPVIRDHLADEHRHLGMLARGLAGGG